MEKDLLQSDFIDKFHKIKKESIVFDKTSYEDAFTSQYLCEPYSLFICDCCKFKIKCKYSNKDKKHCNRFIEALYE